MKLKHKPSKSSVKFHLRSLTVGNDTDCFPISICDIWVGERFHLKCCHMYLPLWASFRFLPSDQQVAFNVWYFIMLPPHGKFQSFLGLAVTTCSPTPVSIYKPYAVVTAENHCRHDVISHKYFINSKFPALQNNLKALILLKASQKLTYTLYYHHRYLGKERWSLQPYKITCINTRIALPAIYVFRQTQPQPMVK